jgi:hypothetical protein
MRCPNGDLHEIDEDLRREAIDERRARFNDCKCSYPDLPGSCPGWRNCPMYQEDAEDDI